LRKGDLPASNEVPNVIAVPKRQACLGSLSQNL
jgi:hypothetical protein